MVPALSQRDASIWMSIRPHSIIMVRQAGIKDNLIHDVKESTKSNKIHSYQCNEQHVRKSLVYMRDSAYR